MYAQEHTIDSLYILLQAKSTEVNKVEILHEISWQYSLLDAQKGLKVANQALKLSTQLKKPYLIATSQKRRGQNLDILGKPESAIEAFQKAITFYKSDQDSTQIATTLFNIGLIYFSQSNYAQSTDHYQEAYSIFKIKKDSMLMAKMLNSIGVNLMYESNYPLSLENFLESKHIYKGIEPTPNLLLGNVCTNTGLLYTRLKNYNQSLALYNEALGYFNKTESKRSIANVLNNIANTYDYMGNSQEALVNYRKSYKLQKSIGHKLGEANALTNIGITYISLSRNKEAIDQLKKTALIYKELSNEANLAIVNEYLGKAYLNLYEKDKKVSYLPTALKHLNDAIDQAEKSGTINTQARIWDMFSQVYSANKDFENAFKAFKNSRRLKDSIFSNEKTAEIAKLEAKYEYAQKETVLKANQAKKDALARAEIKRQKFIKHIAIGTGTAILLIAAIALIFYFKKKKAEEDQAKAEFNAKVAEIELKALRSQMNPHFIFNALNSINYFIDSHDSDLASDYLAKFAYLMRKILENSEKKQVALGEDIKLLKTYIDIESMRLNDKFTYSISIAKNIDIINTLIPPLILQPFIENSIWHGILPKKGAGHIEIEIKKEDDFLVCIIDDNGVGRIQKKGKSISKSMGLQITKHRIEILNELKENKADIKLIDKEEGLRVELILPLKMAF